MQCDLPQVDSLRLLNTSFAQLSQQNFELLKEKVIYDTYNKDEKLLTAGKQAPVVFIIRKGICKETIGSESYMGSIGSIYSLTNLLSPGFLSQTTVVVVETAQVVCIPNIVLIDIMKNDPIFENNLY